jgi:hypothetical protein
MAMKYPLEAKGESSLECSAGQAAVSASILAFIPKIYCPRKRRKYHIPQDG